MFPRLAAPSITGQGGIAARRRGRGMDAEAVSDRPGMACLKRPPRPRSAGDRPIALRLDGADIGKCSLPTFLRQESRAAGRAAPRALLTRTGQPGFRFTSSGLLAGRGTDCSLSSRGRFGVESLGFASLIPAYVTRVFRVWAESLPQIRHVCHKNVLRNGPHHPKTLLGLS